MGDIWAANAESAANVESGALADRGWCHVDMPQRVATVDQAQARDQVGPFRTRPLVGLAGARRSTTQARTSPTEILKRPTLNLHKALMEPSQSRNLGRSPGVAVSLRRPECE